MADLLFEDIVRSYGGIRAVAGVAGRVTQGELVAVIGPNGSGKSSLLDVLSGFVRPDCGRWYLGGVELTGLTPNRVARAGVARTFQAPLLADQMTVRENATFAAECAFSTSVQRQPSGAGPAHAAQVSESLAQFALAEQIDKLAGELSFGQRKMLTLCMAELRCTPLLLLDEPFSGLAPTSIELVSQALLGVRQAGRSVLLVEHNLAVVRRVADRAMLMELGHVVAEGTPSEVFSSARFRDVFEQRQV